jgi:hypothetical protein
LIIVSGDGGPLLQAQFSTEDANPAADEVLTGLAHPKGARTMRFELRRGDNVLAFSGSWKRGPRPDEQPEGSRIRSPGPVEHGRQATVTFNGDRVSLENTPSDLQEMVQDLHFYIADVYAGVMRNQRANLMDTDSRRVMNGICYTVAIGTGFWPIGTLIFGPTAVGCAVLFFMGEL